MTIDTRSDYTFKYNTKLGRHGWLRLTPAYSVKLVKELLQNKHSSSMVLDPFSGTATTGLVAAELGMNAHLFDINPFLIWFGNVKCQTFTIKQKKFILDNKLPNILKSYQGLLDNNNWQPNIFNIERWWCGHTLSLLAALRQAIVIHCDHREPKDLSPQMPENLLWIAFMRLIIETSSAAFNHVSMSFKGEVTKFEINQISKLFILILQKISESMTNNLIGTSQIFHCDSKNIQSQNNIQYDCVITSPPYPNRMTYIRELRPYMYWAGFLHEAKEAGELDWKAIGGTWGIATSKLKSWHNADNIVLPDELNNVVANILNSGDKNSDLMANYVYKYFYDMYLHFMKLRPMLKPNATLNYIVGNSSFYGHLVQSEIIIENLLDMLGYQNISSEIIRKRNCNKNLFEFNISAAWE